MITLYVPLEAKGKARDAIFSHVEPQTPEDKVVLLNNAEPHQDSEDDSLNKQSNADGDLMVVATSSPKACGVGRIAPSRIRETVLVVILGTSMKEFQRLIPRAIERNRPNRVLAFVTGWANEVHETQLRAYLDAKDGITLTVEHLDR